MPFSHGPNSSPESLLAHAHATRKLIAQFVATAARVFASLAIVAGATANAAEVTEWQSGHAPVDLVELYTSEGCNSCPPADAWMSGLRDDSALWQRFVPVNLHVDYWDRLGWRDRFARAAHTERQYRYNAEGGSAGVYTPAVFINGAATRDAAAYIAALSARGGSTHTTAAGNLILRADADGQLTVQYTPPFADNARRSLRASVALLGSGLASEVRAGENRGKTLRHDFVALTLNDASMTESRGVYVAIFPRPLPAVHAPRLGIAAWVSDDDRLKPLQAVGGWYAVPSQAQ